MNRNIIKIAIFFSIIIIFLFSCGSENQGEEYSDLEANGIILIKENHIGGWGYSECIMCHHIENIHLDNESTRTFVVSAGSSSCTRCHGSNGSDTASE
ncbi:MAG: hypothetical protein ABIA04_09335 [Pseudomonadota bacterium]